jgi:hypothetical protein
VLFARGPRNEFGAKKDTETADEFAVIKATHPISIRIALKVVIWRVTKEQAIGDGGLKIP